MGIVEIAIDAPQVVVRAPELGGQPGRAPQRIACGAERRRRDIDGHLVGRPVLALRALPLGLVECHAIVQLVHRLIRTQRDGALGRGPRLAPLAPGDVRACHCIPREMIVIPYCERRSALGDRSIVMSGRVLPVACVEMIDRRVEHRYRDDLAQGRPGCDRGLGSRRAHRRGGRLCRSGRRRVLERVVDQQALAGVIVVRRAGGPRPGDHDVIAESDPGQRQPAHELLVGHRVALEPGLAARHVDHPDRGLARRGGGIAEIEPQPRTQPRILPDRQHDLRARGLGIGIDERRSAIVDRDHVAAGLDLAAQQRRAADPQLARPVNTALGDRQLEARHRRQRDPRLVAGDLGPRVGQIIGLRGVRARGRRDQQHQSSGPRGTHRLRGRASGLLQRIPAVAPVLWRDLANSARRAIGADHR